MAEHEYWKKYNHNLVKARLPPKLLLRFGHWRHSFDETLNVSEALNKALDDYLPHYPHIED